MILTQVIDIALLIVKVILSDFARKEGNNLGLVYQTRMIECKQRVIEESPAVLDSEGMRQCAEGKSVGDYIISLSHLTLSGGMSSRLRYIRGSLEKIERHLRQQK